MIGPIQIDQLPKRQLKARSTGELLSVVASLAEPYGLDRLLVHHETLEPGKRASRPHVHSRKQELIVVLSGNPTAIIGDEKFQLNPNDILGFPPANAEPHTLVNESDRDVIFLSIATNDPTDITSYRREEPAIT